LHFYIQLVVTILIGAGGWIAVHRFTSERDLRNSRRELRTEKLLQIYEKLARASDRTVTAESLCDIEDAVSLLQLLGTKTDIETVVEMAKGLGGDHPEGMDISALLLDLRNAIRKELGLEPYSGVFAFIRLDLGGKDPRQIMSEKGLSPPT
jgi:hypothetical protein